jgi:cell division initiation protein
MGMSTRLTAMDIEKQDFTRKMRGFDPDEVQMFLRAVAEEIERLNLENGTLREENGSLTLRLDEFKDRERTLQETLVTAQRMSADLRDRSKQEAELLVREARVKAERLLEQAQDQLQSLENEIGRVRLEKDAFENRLRASIEEHLSLLDLRRQEKADIDNLDSCAGVRRPTPDDRSRPRRRRHLRARHPRRTLRASRPGSRPTPHRPRRRGGMPRRPCGLRRP